MRNFINRISVKVIVGLRLDGDVFVFRGREGEAT